MLKIDKYEIIQNEEFGHGGFGQILLAKDLEEKGDEKHLFVLKIPLEDKMTGEDKEIFNNEIDILRILSDIEDNKYTPKIYGFKKFDNERKQPFYAMDFISKGLLFDYAKFGKLSLRHKKYIFRNIILGLKFLHKNGICHLDIKMENIILDKEFWPVIVDFGFAKKYKNEKGEIILLKADKGTKYYACPEIWEQEKINGEKADIFSLGVLLFSFVNGIYGFKNSKINNKLYKLIIDEKPDEYWSNFPIGELSDDFKKLYFKMVSFKPEERPTLDKILNNAWLKEVSNLTQLQDDEIKKELKAKYNTLKSEKEKNIEKKVKEEHLITRGGEDDKDSIFRNSNLKPKKISKDRLNINKAIKINGNLKEVDFMNSLSSKIIEKFGDNCYIEPSKKDLKFEVIFESEGEEEEETKECKMIIELFKYEEGEYLLEFRRTGGNIPEHYEYFLKMEEIIDKMI